jgi:uncharacterized membrane protein YbhN (UPF0104 family)
MRERVLSIARSPLGRVTLALVGLGAIAVLVLHSHPEQVWNAIVRARWALLWVVLLEGVSVAGSVAALGAMYRDAGAQIPLPLLVRTGLIGYAVAGLVPAGRAASEATRAALLSGHAGQGRAAAAALRLQGVALLANSVLSFTSALGTLALVGPGLLALLIAANGLLSVTLGGGALILERRGRLGVMVGRWLPGLRSFGRELDEHLGEAPFPGKSLGFELLSRAAQVAQNGILVAAVGGAIGLAPALCAEGIHLLGATVGDLIPQQLGATDANFTLSASALGLPPGDAMAIALLAHLSQLVWVAAGALVPLLWPPPRRRELVT